MMRMKPIVSKAINKWPVMREPAKRYGSTITYPVTQENQINDIDVNWEFARPYEEIPGPNAIPILGNTFRFLPYIGEFSVSSTFDQLCMFRNKYGNMVRLEKLLGRRPTIFLFDPDLCKKMYRLEGTWPMRQALLSLKYYREKTNWNDGLPGLTVSNGKKWHEFRTKVNQPMMQVRTIIPHVATIDEVACDLITRIHQLRDTKTMELPPTFNNELNKWGLESICAIALETRLGCLEQNLDENSDPQRMINAVHDMFDLLYKLELLPSLWKYYDTRNIKKLFRALDTINEITLQRIAETRQRMQRLPTIDIHNRSMLQRLLAIDEQTALGMAMDMLIAGIDTTSNTMSMLLYYISANSRVQKKVTEEVDRVLPTKESPVTFAILNEIPYLKACIKETLRLNPIAIGVLRTMQNNVVLGGYQIYKGTDIVACHSVISRDAKNYPQPSDFIPERWIRSNTEAPLAKEAHPFAYMPFGFGPRTCIGRRFAELEMEILAMRIFRNFHLAWHHPPPKIKHRFISTVDSPLQFKVIDR